MSVALVFPGQGSQIVGMGRDLYESVPAARTIFERADALLGLPITRLCFEGPEEQLTATENAQPALLTTCLALLRALEAVNSKQTLLHPAAVAGHSLGEYAAFVASGALDFATALRLVRRRGEIMAEAREGTMAAVLGLDAPVLEKLCREVGGEDDQTSVVIANYNAPGQFVISGATAAVEEVGRRARAQGAKRVMPLKVSAAFHSPLMRLAASQMTTVLAHAPIVDPQMPLIANVTAEPLTTAAEVRAELIAQIAAPVRWIASVEQMVALGITTFVEVGPGKVLTGLIKRIAPTTRCVNIGGVEEVHTFTKGL